MPKLNLNKTTAQVALC